MSNFHRTFRRATSADIRRTQCPNLCHHPPNNVNRFRFNEELFRNLSQEKTLSLDPNRSRTPYDLLIEYRRKLPVLDPVQQSGRVYSAAHVRLFPALELVADGESITSVTLKWEGQEFKKVATPWELANSPLAIKVGRKYTIPVVDLAGTVIGYYSQKRSPRDVWTNKEGEVIYRRLVLAGQRDMSNFGWRRLGGGDNCDILFNIDGELIEVIRVYDRALEPSLLFEVATGIAGLGRGIIIGLGRKIVVSIGKAGMKTLIKSKAFAKVVAKKLSGIGLGSKAKVTAARSLSSKLTKSGDDLVFVEIGAGDLKASLLIARSGRVKVIAVDPGSSPSAAAIKELQDLGGKFVKGTAADIKPGSADHVFQYFPWRIEGTGSYFDGGTWRLIDDTRALLRPNGAAHFVTESKITAEFLVKEAAARNMRVALTPSTAGTAAKGASGVGVPNFSSDLGVWVVNIYK